MDSKMNERKGGGTHENVENWETELPPFSTFLNKRPLDREMSTRRCDGGVRSQTVPPGPQVPGMEQPAYGGQMVPIQVNVRQMQSVQGKNGHIKRPMNAFMVWSRIHRHALRKACPDTTMTDTSILLGSEWSKLTIEQKRPYYEVAHRLNAMHKHVPESTGYCPQQQSGV
uniref:HMG box domain-containing protein n=1 Tax=Anabas testudineus TaxID=64144 RepID=A0A7N6A8C3_ANATE